MVKLPDVEAKDNMLEIQFLLVSKVDKFRHTADLQKLKVSLTLSALLIFHLNLDTLAEAFNAGDAVDPGKMRTAGVLKKQGFVKILGRGTIDKALNVKAHAYSATAKAAIEAAGGTCEVVPLPWGDNRRPAQGNQHTNH